MSRPLGEDYPNAFLTGASAGLGRAFAEMLLSEGVRVWGTARDVGRLTELAARYPATFTPVAIDLAEPAAAEAAFKRSAQSVGGSFDLVINNAGYGVFGPFHEVDFPIWQKELDAMIVTTLRLSHAAIGAMWSRKRGCLVNVSSIAAELPLPFMSGYNVAKAALSAFSESLILETRGTGIKVVDFRPGDFRTDFNRAMLTQNTGVPTSHGSTSIVWDALEKHRLASPSPLLAAQELRRTLQSGRSGTVRTGTFFQARVAPLLGRLIPGGVRRAIIGKYYGL